MSKYPYFIKDRLQNQEVHIVASGPSLTHFDYSYFDNKNSIAVNHSYKKLKNPLWTVACDRGFIDHEDPDAPNNTTLLCRLDPRYPQNIDFGFSDGFSLNPFDGVYHRKSSGISAITTALHAGATMIYLWGFDYCYVNGLAHATQNEFKHRKNDEERRPGEKGYHESFAKALTNKIKYFTAFKDVKNIYNMSKKSAIPDFPIHPDAI